MLLSGASGSGKTALALRLARLRGFHIVSARQVLMAEAGANPTRAALVRLGSRLEVETNGRWLADAVSAQWEREPTCIVDSARTLAQVTECTRVGGFNSRHLHVTADAPVRRKRFEERASSLTGWELSFDELGRDLIEETVESLSALADSVLDTTGLRIDEACSRALDVLDGW